MKSLIIALACVATLASTAALAKTPDGETPAEEEVCDDYTGKAFGICNAYCEAMDCDYDAPKASDKACDVKEAQFEKLTGEKMPPCDDADACLSRCATTYKEALAACYDSERVSELCLARAKSAYAACTSSCEDDMEGEICSFKGAELCKDYGGSYVKNEDGSCSCVGE